FLRCAVHAVIDDPRLRLVVGINPVVDEQQLNIVGQERQQLEVGFLDQRLHHKAVTFRRAGAGSDRSSRLLFVYWRDASAAKDCTAAKTLNRFPPRTLCRSSAE